MSYEAAWSQVPADPSSDRNENSAPLSVSAAMALAKQSLESVTVRMVGEVSEVSIKAGYKAAYFTVKDSSASLPCMMWNNRYRASGVELSVGMLVELTGRFTLYAAKGRMNFDVFSIALAGEGDLRLRVANIAKRLSAEGLTDPARKRRLPLYPQRIGLVTSPRSAAVHDVLRTFRRRFPVAEVLLAGVPVEGAQAPLGIAEGIRCVVSGGAQVVLVVRGGGSFEDLMPFNDEMLARTIAACPVPVVTGIGHEVDTTIADMVSDVRASTPTAAAEAVTPARENLDAHLTAGAQALDARMRYAFQNARLHLRRIEERPMFKDPSLLFSQAAQGIDLASERLSRALPAQLERNREALSLRAERLERDGAALTERFEYAVRASAARLEDLSPVKTLARGYSITRNEEGEILRKVEQAPIGSKVGITLSNGELSCEVLEVSRKEETRKDI